jgi:hypothetical protein
MTRGSVGACLLAFCACLAVAAPLAAQSSQRVIYASALDQSGAPVESLAPTDVVVREDKVAREVLSIVPATEPLEIALLVDNSQAAEAYIRDYREALAAFITAIGADESGIKHQIALITTAERPTISVDYSTDLARVQKGAERIFAMPGSGAYLLDAIIETSRGITKRHAARPVIVAITTEGPELSDRQYSMVLEPLRASGATLHVIVVGRPVNNSTDRSIVLDLGTRDTGGRFDTLLTTNGLPAKMKQVAAELTHQWKITYSRPQSLIPPEQVTIGSARPNLTVRGIAAKE